MSSINRSIFFIDAFVIWQRPDSAFNHTQSRNIRREVLHYLMLVLCVVQSLDFPEQLLFNFVFSTSFWLIMPAKRTYSKVVVGDEKTPDDSHNWMWAYQQESAKNHRQTHMTLTTCKICGVFATSFNFGPPTYFISHYRCGRALHTVFYRRDFLGKKVEQSCLTG